MLLANKIFYKQLKRWFTKVYKKNNNAKTKKV